MIRRPPISTLSPYTTFFRSRTNASFGFRSTHSFAPCFRISSPTGVFRRQGIEALSTMNVWEKKLEARQGKGEKQRKRQPKIASSHMHNPRRSEIYFARPQI